MKLGQCPPTEEALSGIRPPNGLIFFGPVLQQRDNTNQNIEGRILLNDPRAEHQQWQSKVTVGLAIGGET